MKTNETIISRLKKAGVNLIKKADEAYLEYNGRITILPNPKCYVTVCKTQFGVMI